MAPTAHSLPPLPRTVVVVTGASSGIGRATALRLGRSGASLALAARDAEALDEVAAVCRHLGAVAVPVPTDVSDPEAVEALASTTVERFGRIDAWVNDAGVAAYGRFLDTPLEEVRRVLDVNLLGTIHGCRAALPRMLDQHHGVIVNVASLLSEAPSPYLSSYVASKFAVRGLTLSLRTELVDQPAVQVCLVHPPSVDTPLFHHAANESGQEVRAVPPVYDVEAVADAIVAMIERPRAEVRVGATTKLASLSARVSPALATWVTAQYAGRLHLTGKPAAPDAGNLAEPPADERTTTGGWRMALGRIPGLAHRPATARRRMLWAARRDREETARVARGAPEARRPPEPHQAPVPGEAAAL